MTPDKLIDAYQLDTYLRDYNISTGLDVINYRLQYDLSNYIDGYIDTNIFYGELIIVDSSIVWKSGVTEQEKSLILTALNKLRLRVNC